MQLFFSLPIAALLLPASAPAQDRESWHRRRPARLHPGHDADRGPAAFDALRLHRES